MPLPCLTNCVKYNTIVLYTIVVGILEKHQCKFGKFQGGCMKNMIKLPGIITFVAIIGFLLAACSGGTTNGGGGSGGGGGGHRGGRIPAKIRFSGDSTRPLRSVLGSRSVASIMRSSENGTEGSEQFDIFYEEKWGHFIEAITPNKLELAVSELTLVSEDGDIVNLIGGGGTVRLVDLAKPIIITPGEIESLTYRLLSFLFSLTTFVDIEGNRFTSRVSFPWPDDITYNDHVYNTGHIFIYGREHMDGYEVNMSGNNIEMALGLTSPGTISLPVYYGNEGFGFNDDRDPSKSYVTDLTYIYMGGNSRKIISDRTFNIKEEIDDKLPDWEANGGIPIGSVIVPFNNGNGVTIPDDAKAVRFEIYWDLDGLIERYSGCKPDDPNDDIFILKNGFWNAFSIQTVIEYSDSEEPVTE